MICSLSKETSKCLRAIEPPCVDDVDGESAFGGNLTGCTHRVDGSIKSGQTDPEVARDHLLGDQPFTGAQRELRWRVALHGNDLRGLLRVLVKPRCRIEQSAHDACRKAGILLKP